jgi:hypothetical protein
MNQQIENAAVNAQRRYYSDQQINDSRHQNAFNRLRTELMGALLGDPTKIVETPGFDPSRMSALSVVAEQVSGDSEQALLACLVRVLSLSAQGRSEEAKAASDACIEFVCDRHAAWHVGDALNQEAHDDYKGWEA